MRKILISITVCLLLCFSLTFTVYAVSIISEKPGFFSATVNDTGIVALSIRSSDYDYFYYNGYSGMDSVGSEYDYDDYDTTYSDTEYPTGYELYRSDMADGEYVLIASGELTLSSYGVDVADSTAVMGATYYYKARYTAVSGDTIIYGEFGDPIIVSVVPSPSKITSVKATKANTFTISWDQAINVDGYNIYMKEFDNEYLYSLHSYSRYEMDGINIDTYQVPDAVKNIPFTLVGSASAGETSMMYDKAKHGMGYIFAIRTYKTVNGNKVESSTMAKLKS